MSATTDCLHPKQAQNDTTVEAVIQHYEELKVASQEIDKLSVLQEESGPDIVHDSFDFDVPIVDLSTIFKLERLKKEIAQCAGESERLKNIQEQINACEVAKADVEKRIRAACEEYGFFQIVNHDFPVELINQLSHFSRQIFDLPTEKKMEASAQGPPRVPSPTSYQSFLCTHKLNYSHIRNEALILETPELLYPGVVTKMIDVLWPEPEKSRERQQLRSIIEEYGNQSSKLCFLLLNLMATSFGLPEGSVEDLLGYTELETQIHARIRVNHYPLCLQPQLTWGLHGHTDPSAITLLHQDSVGGLQIRFRDGTWHGVRPIAGAFVVNSGDMLQAWTNGRFRSSMHRVVTNEKSDRLSIAYFVYNSLDSVLRPRPEFVDAEHPLQYRPFTRRELFATVTQNGVNRGREGIQFLSQYFRPEIQT